MMTAILPIVRRCEFSPCRYWRYTLWREWGAVPKALGFPDWPREAVFGRADEVLMVIGLNPSTATETQDDPTIRRLKGFAQRWGFGALCMTNIFAWRDTDPRKMKQAADPVGADNDAWLLRSAAGAGMVLAAWGGHGAHLGRGEAVCGLLQGAGVALHTLRHNADGSPEHPLYLPKGLVPGRWESVASIATDSKAGYARHIHSVNPTHENP